MSAPLFRAIAMGPTDWVGLTITVLGSMGVWKLLSKKIAEIGTKTEKQLDKKFFQMVAEQMHTLASQRAPEKTRGIDIDFENGTRYVTLMILGEWIQVGTGVKVQGLYEKGEKTVYQIQIDNVWRLRRHRHSEREILEVINGRMIDIETGKQYHKGEEWDIPAGEFHAVEFLTLNDEPCMIKVTTIPALKTLEHTPLMLDDMQGLVGLS